MKTRAEMVEAIVREIHLRKDFFEGQTKIRSIYFGGGTPSILTGEELGSILNALHKNFSLEEVIEITLEANPDDLSKEQLTMLAGSGINRLSIGVQALNEDLLKWMNRSHNVTQAMQSIEYAQQAGFKDLNVDFIYGVPGLKDEDWQKSLAKLLDWPVNHLSAYSLTLEDRTPYKKLVSQGKYPVPDEDDSVRHYDMLTREMKMAGWDHYEVSNFCKPGHIAVHNSAYWQGKAYLGIGPSAHSYDGRKRSWNISNNQGYIESIREGNFDFEQEELGDNERYNEYMLTGLRTKWGINLTVLNTVFGVDLMEEFGVKLDDFMRRKWMYREGDHLRLSEEGFRFADHISSELFI